VSRGFEVWKDYKDVPIDCSPGARPLQPKQRKLGKNAITALDIFAGAGGFSVGAEQANVKVVWAINHFKEAIATHALNHPYTEHVCQSVYEFNWNDAPLTDMILASPSCKCHSEAATGGLHGGTRRHTAPAHDELRANPEAVISCVSRAYSMGRHPIVVIENVPEFRKWVLYKPFVVNALEAMGYAVSEHVLDALDFGVPSRRKRLFVIAVPGRVAFDLPRPRKRKQGTIGPLIVKQANWVPLKDWAKPSIAAKAKEQLGRIKARLGRKVPEYWVWTNTSDTNPIMPDKPFRTVTAKIGGQTYAMKSRGRRHWIRPILPAELRGFMGFPKSYKIEASPSLAGELLGNAVAPPMIKFVVGELVRRA